MPENKVFVVIPTNRSLKFLEKWEKEFKDTYGIIIEGHLNKEIAIPKKYFKKVYHYSWTDMDREFGNKAWIFSRYNAGVRSFGFYKAFELGAQRIITLDDDCYPAEPNLVKKHLENLEFKAPEGWWPTYPNPKLLYTRGFPYNIRNKVPIKLSHGLWSGALDLDAKTETGLKQLLCEPTYPPIRQVVPKNYFFPMCSMNLAFSRDAVPLTYFPLMGSDKDKVDWGFDRYDDIWAGVFLKKIFDHLGWGIVNGSPFVEHKKESQPKDNLKREMQGMKENETLWKRVDSIRLTKQTAAECYKELAIKIRFPHTNYFKKLRQAMIIWSELFF